MTKNTGSIYDISDEDGRFYVSHDAGSNKFCLHIEGKCIILPVKEIVDVLNDIVASEAASR